MFICNHCPYVKAVVAKIVRDMTELREHGVGSIAIMSNDPVAYPDDSFDKMKAFAREHAFTFPVRARRNAGRRADLRRRLHARFLRLRPELPARLPRPARRVGTLSDPNGEARALRRHGVDRAQRKGARSSASVGRLLDQVAGLRNARNASSTASGCSAISAVAAVRNRRRPWHRDSAAIRRCAFFAGAIRSRAPRIASTGQRTFAALSSAALY